MRWKDQILLNNVTLKHLILYINYNSKRVLGIISFSTFRWSFWNENTLLYKSQCSKLLTKWIFFPKIIKIFHYIYYVNISNDFKFYTNKIPNLYLTWNNVFLYIDIRCDLFRYCTLYYIRHIQFSKVRW